MTCRVLFRRLLLVVKDNELPSCMIYWHIYAVYEDNLDLSSQIKVTVTVKLAYYFCVPKYDFSDAFFIFSKSL
jgi:hypothetical protein